MAGDWAGFPEACAPTDARGAAQRCQVCDSAAGRGLPSGRRRARAVDSEPACIRVDD